MVIYAFTAINRRKVIRISLDFWYKNLKNVYNLNEFLKKCCLCKYCNEYVVFYTGPKIVKGKCNGTLSKV
jgi:hypothetical protein